MFENQNPQDEKDQLLFAMKCQCLIENDGYPFRPINTQTRFATISLIKPDRIRVGQYGKKDSCFAEYKVGNLRMVHKKFINEGMMTLEIFSGVDKERPQTLHCCLSAPLKKQFITCLVISNAVEETLRLFLDKVNVMVKQLPRSREQIILKQNSEMKTARDTSQSTSNARPSTSALTKTKNPRLLKLAQAREQERELEQKLKRPAPIAPKKISPSFSGPGYMFEQQIPGLNPAKTQLWDLPSQIVSKVMAYAGMTLRERLVCKMFSQMILQQLRNIKLEANVDQHTFRKLTAYALRVECRMKNIRDISHFKELGSGGILTQANAKTLKFGKWKQVTAKNMQQLKCTRIYRLELPYLMKVPSENLLGLKLVYLKLKTGNNSSSPNRKNELIKDEDLITLINSNDCLTMLSVGYATSSLIDGISKCSKMKTLKIQTLESKKGSEWKSRLREFTSLEHLSIAGVTPYSNHSIPLQLPQSIRKLKLGEFASHDTLNNLPDQVHSLTLISQQLKNDNILEMPLHNVRFLDIRVCPNLTHYALENCQNLTVRSRWCQILLANAKTYFQDTRVNILNQ